MQHNPDRFSKYREHNSSEDEAAYVHPDYYQVSNELPSRSEQPLQQVDTYTGTAANSTHADPSLYAPQNPYEVGQMQAYSGPEHMEGYIKEVGSKQQEAASRGSAEPGKIRKAVTGLGGIGIAIVSWLAKIKGLLFFLKFGTLGFSALLSIVVYSFVFGWAFAVGLVGLLFIHEMGHALVMKLKGIPVGGMVFIPMMGAMVTMLQMPKNAKDEAEVGIAGPIAGAIASAVCLLIAQSQPHTVWAPLAYFGFFMNLFNLVPIVPFDGGRVLAAIDRRVWVLGFLALLGYQIWSWLHGNVSLWLLFFVIMAATQLWSRGLKPSTPEARAYYDVPVSSRVMLTVLYFGLAIVLFLGMSLAHGLMPIAGV